MSASGWLIHLKITLDVVMYLTGLYEIGLQTVFSPSQPTLQQPTSFTIRKASAILP
jgi:hypothetical protein